MKSINFEVKLRPPVYSLNYDYSKPVFKIVQMKKDDIYIMLLGLGIAMISASFYFSNRNGFIMNKFMISINKSFHFNCTPLIGITFMALGEIIIWQSKNNSNLNEYKNTFIQNLKVKTLEVQSTLKIF